jgi:hypothetical protein
MSIWAHMWFLEFILGPSFDHIKIFRDIMILVWPYQKPIFEDLSC